jgi:hypothetical protein
VEQYSISRRGDAPRPSARKSQLAFTFLATASARTFDIDDPLVSTELNVFGKPRSCLSQPNTCSSTRLAAFSKELTLGFIAAAKKSPSMPSGSPVPFTQPQNLGWLLPRGYGHTCRRKSS